MDAQGCCGLAGEVGVSSLEAAEVCTVYVWVHLCVWVHLRVWVHAGNPVCSLLAPGGTFQLLVHFKLILLMLPSFILLSLSANLWFCLAHHLCDSYPVNSQHLTCPHCQPKLPLEELTAASQGMLWRPKARASLFCEGPLCRQRQREGLPSSLCLTCPL